MIRLSGKYPNVGINKARLGMGVPLILSDYAVCLQSGEGV